MNGVLVGEWSVGRTGHHVFQYNPAWRDHPRSRPLSLSLPLTADGRIEGAVVERYFDNLLPDNDAPFQSRPAMRSRLSTKPRLGRRAKPNRHLMPRQNWMAVSEKVFWRPRLPLAGAYHRMSLSSQIVSDPLALSAALYSAQLVVL
jgi:HipA-like protein